MIFCGVSLMKVNIGVDKGLALNRHQVLIWMMMTQFFNSLAPGKFELNFRYVIFKQILEIDVWGVSSEIAPIWMSLDFTDDQSTLVQVMAWRRQATSHYLSQCWPRSLSPYGVTRPQQGESSIPPSNFVGRGYNELSEIHIIWQQRIKDGLRHNGNSTLINLLNKSHSKQWMNKRVETPHTSLISGKNFQTNLVSLFNSGVMVCAGFNGFVYGGHR